MAIGGGVAGFIGGAAIGYRVIDATSDLILWPFQAIQRRKRQAHDDVTTAGLKAAEDILNAAVQQREPLPTPTPA